MGEHDRVLCGGSRPVLGIPLRDGLRGIFGAWGFGLRFGRGGCGFGWGGVAVVVGCGVVAVGGVVAADVVAVVAAVAFDGVALVAEMELENPQLLRILGYRLMQVGQPRLAVAVFEEVLKMREEEPQSYRDLALALSADKQHQRAVNLLQEVVEGQWDNRFPNIELTALNEMNAILATCGKELQAGNVDQRLLKNLPVDVRVILTWDADNTDMDLWVIDPNGEKCDYSHRDTIIGGHMSPDYTGGYGPEEFLLKRAQPGKYLVHANYYGNRQQVIAGATTVQLEMTTDFGKPIAKTESVTLRLQGSKEVIKVGEFVIPGKTQYTNRRSPRKR